MSEDIVGKKYGEWTILGYAPKVNRMKRVKCQCSCGKICERYFKHLKSGASKSCGHQNWKENCRQIGKGNLKYTNFNVADTRLYSTWKNMKKRCYCKNNERYKNYGARGIKICDEWLNDFMSFYNWAINNGYKENLTIDRINNDGNYEPNNCRWATAKQQANNRRKLKTSRYLTYKNKSQTVTEWCKEYNINYSTLSCRINKLKWNDEKALKDFIERKKANGNN